MSLRIDVERKILGVPMACRGAYRPNKKQAQNAARADSAARRGHEILTHLTVSLFTGARTASNTLTSSNFANRSQGAVECSIGLGTTHLNPPRNSRTPALTSARGRQALVSACAHRCRWPAPIRSAGPTPCHGFTTRTNLAVVVSTRPARPAPWEARSFAVRSYVPGCQSATRFP